MLIFDAEIKKVIQKNIVMFKQIMQSNAERFYCRSIDQHKQSYNFKKL